MTGTNANNQQNNTDPISAPFEKIVRRSQLALAWERTWPGAVSTAMTGGLFMAVSLAGCWQYLPPAGRAAGVLLFAAALLASPFRFRGASPLVSRKDAIARIDQHLGDPSQPARFLGNSLASGNSPEGIAHWNERREACWNQWGSKMKAGMPSPQMNRHDPLRLRYAVAATVLASAIAAGDQWQDRIKMAFDWATPAAAIVETDKQLVSQALRVRGWVSPPEKIDRAPQHISDATTGEVQVHKNSLLTILVSGREAVITINGKVLDKPKRIEADSGKDEDASYQYETLLTGDRVVVAIQGGPTWAFDVLPDNAPRVNIKSVTPTPQDKNSTTIDYSVQDDFGVDGVDAVITPINPDKDARPLPSGRQFSFPAR
jgi:hypothetical protein